MDVISQTIPLFFRSSILGPLQVMTQVNPSSFKQQHSYFIIHQVTYPDTIEKGLRENKGIDG